MNSRQKMLGALVLAAAIALAGCGPDRAGGQGGGSPAEPTYWPAESGWSGAAGPASEGTRPAEGITATPAPPAGATPTPAP